VDTCDAVYANPLVADWNMQSRRLTGNVTQLFQVGSGNRAQIELVKTLCGDNLEQWAQSIPSILGRAFKKGPLT